MNSRPLSRGEHVAKVDAELQRIFAGILALMDENLIPSASTGEPKAFNSEKKDDYYRFFAERATGDAKRHVPMIQKVLKTVEGPQMQYSDRIDDLLVVTQRRIPTAQTAQRTIEVPKIVSQDRIPQQTVEQLVDIPVPQVTEEILEMFNVLSQNRVQQRNVEQITETPAVSLAEEIMECTTHLVQETVEMPQVQFLDRVRGRIIEETDVTIPRLMKETIEVEKPKSQRFTLLADNKLAPKLDDGCAVQARQSGKSYKGSETKDR